MPICSAIIYCYELAHYRRETFVNPVHPSLSFDVTIKSRAAPLGSDYRPLPPFALQGSEFQLVLRTGIYNEPGRLSQVWVADVKRKEVLHLWYGRILLKCFQASFLLHPQPTWYSPLSEYEFPRELAGMENLVYNTLEDLQGSAIPYYYGKHKFIMPNGESTRVILLEYMEGNTLAQLQDKYPIHEPPRYQPLPRKSYDEWLEIAKELYVPALRGMSAITERKILHRDLKAENTMITSTSPKQVVYIDFAFSALRVPQHILDAHNNHHLSVALLTGCCNLHREDVEQWAKKNLPGGLAYPSGSD